MDSRKLLVLDTIGTCVFLCVLYRYYTGTKLAVWCARGSMENCIDRNGHDNVFLCFLLLRSLLCLQGLRQCWPYYTH